MWAISALLSSTSESFYTLAEALDERVNYCEYLLDCLFELATEEPEFLAKNGADFSLLSGGSYAI